MNPNVESVYNYRRVYKEMSTGTSLDIPFEQQKPVQYCIHFQGLGSECDVNALAYVDVVVFDR